MAISTDSYYDIQVGGITVDQVGLSKTLNQYTITELQDYVYCGANLSLIRNLTSGDQKNLINAIASGDPSPVSAEQTGIGHYAITSGDDLTYDYPNGIQSATIWLAYSFGETPLDFITNSLPSNAKLITEMPANKLEYILPSPRVSYTGFATSWAENSGVAYDCRFDSAVLQYRVSSNVTEQVSPWGGPVLPYTIITTDNSVTLVRLDLSIGSRCSWYSRGQGWDDSNATGGGGLVNYNTPQSWDEHHGFCFTISTAHTDFTQLDSATVMPIDWNWRAGSPDWGMSGWYAAKTYETDIIGQIVFNGQPSDGVGYQRSISTNYWLNNFDSANRFIANIGVKFYTDKLYKPIIENGWVIGYTDNMDTPSDLDNWTGSTKHSVTPPSPTPSGDGEDDIESMGFDGMSCNVGGPAKYYIMSYSEIHHLIGDFNVHAEPGTSISNNIISCYINALDWNWSTGSEPIEIYSGGAQTTAFTSDMNYAVLTGYNARDIIGSIDVPRMTNTFYDFSPYSTYEVYVPFCGWVALPDTVAGRTIKIYFETDEATCGCKGRVFFVDGNGYGVTVAEITGSFGAPCPIQVIEGGLYKGAMLSNGLQVIGGIANGVMGGASGSGILAVGGLTSAMQGLGNCLVAGNTNYGQTIGRAGDASGLMCAGKPYLKITYPPIDEVVNNSMFAHTVGYLCNTIGQLSNFHGFTVCANPHIHISATSTEKEEIKRLLEEGVILP